MKREILVGKEDRAFLMKLFGVTNQTIYNALDLKNPPVGVRGKIRKAAMERGGVVMVTLPEVETWHDAEGLMHQRLKNGAELEVSKLDGDCRVIHKGKVVRKYDNITVSKLFEIQMEASALR